MFKTYEIPEYSDGYEFKNTIKITLQENIVDNAKNLQMKEAPRLICEINGLLVDDDKVAKVFAENIVNKICKRLSLIFFKAQKILKNVAIERLSPLFLIKPYLFKGEKLYENV